MASSINASLTAGLVSTADTTGNLNLQSGGTTILAIASTGATIQGLTVGKGSGAVASNTAVGVSALGGGSQSGAYNAAFGQSALAANTTGSFNTAIAREALATNTTGQHNTSVGHDGMYNNTTGSYNVAIGSAALQANTTASYNTAVGRQAGNDNTTGYQNAFFGQGAGYKNTTGNLNTYIGDSAGPNITASTGSSNTAVGQATLINNTSASNNTAIGYASMYTNTTGTYNVAVGTQDASGFSTLGSNTTGYSNVAIGTAALTKNTIGYFSTAIGFKAGFSNVTGLSNVFVGAYAGFSSIATGSGANTIGGNTFVGTEAGYSVTTGTGNTFIGCSNTGTSTYGAGYYVTTGSKNTILGGYNGNQNGLDLRTSSNNIVLSDGDGVPHLIISSSGTVSAGNGGDVASSTNSKVFNSGSYSSSAAVPNFVGNWMASNNWGIGSHTNASSAYVRIGVVSVNAWTGAYAAIYAGAYTNASDYRIKENVINYAQSGLAQVMALRPVTYKIKDTEATNSDGSVETNAGEQTIGFIAHEVQAVIPELVSGTKDEVDGNGVDIHQGLDYAKMVTVLVKAIQELKAEIDLLKGVK